MTRESEPARPQRYVAIFAGNVQGVGFRYATARLAAEREVAGYVRNLPDGRVEIVIEGDTEELDRFLAAIQRRMHRFIRGMTTRIESPTGEFSRFEVRY